MTNQIGTDNKLAARADLCRFLSACYYEPSPAFAEERLFESMADVAGALDAELDVAASELGQAFAAAEPQALLVDYTRLFLGPVRAVAMPYGSMWLPGDATLMQDSTMAVRELYAQGGFELGDDFADLPDHVAVELEFLYVLLLAELDARQVGDDVALQATLSIRRQFLQAHLGAWVDAFASAVTANAGTPFYRLLAELTRRVVAGERQHLMPVQPGDA